MKEGSLTLESSPHPWGCFHGGERHPVAGVVFPTPVGVFPSRSAPPVWPVCLPHTRGGVSSCNGRHSCCGWSSPHPWGCFHNWTNERIGKEVFPTPVGVFLFHVGSLALGECLPHTRGGVSSASHPPRPQVKSSPHPWGCFLILSWFVPLTRVFPTPVGVFPIRRMTRDNMPCLPHTRGGVSIWVRELPDYPGSSPHPWGCFFMHRRLAERNAVFPTPVGVFPFAHTGQTAYRGLPHTRGGVSTTARRPASSAWSSPHPWGCFYLRLPRCCASSVFPTPVGVFLFQYRRPGPR